MGAGDHKIYINRHNDPIYANFKNSLLIRHPRIWQHQRLRSDLRITRLQWRDRVGITPNFPNLTLRHL